MAELSYLPQTAGGLDAANFTGAQMPGLTYKLDAAHGRVKGTTDEKDAVLQAVYVLLNVERYAYPIYSRNYGVELSELIGKPKDYAMSEIKRLITEALSQDDRITGITDWEFTTGRNTVTASFTINTIYGDVSATKEVEI